VRRLEIIGEAAKNIDDSFRDKYPQIPWKKIAGMRDIIVHEYFGVRLDRVWDVVRKDMPDLKGQSVFFRCFYFVYFCLIWCVLPVKFGEMGTPVGMERSLCK
jgi:hypothetical protein